MRIGMSTNQPLSFPEGLDHRPLGAGGQIQLHHLAAALQARGHEVDVVQAQGTITDAPWANYRDYASAAEVEYDASIGYCVPDTARWLNGKRRYVSIQNDNHWLPVEPEAFDGVMPVLVGQCLYDHYAQFMPQEQLALIGNGYPSSMCFPDESQRNLRSVCFSAAPTHSSGLHVALDALIALGRSDIEFHVYGTLELWGQALESGILTAQQEYEKLLFERIDAAPCRVVLHGALPYHQMLSEYTKHVAMLHPKTHETFGCSIVEAQASGCIPIVADVYGCHDRVKTGAGIGCQHDDPAEFADALRIVLESESARQELRQVCVEYAQSFTYERIAEQWEQLMQPSSS